MNRPRLLLILAALFCALNLAAQNQSLDALRDEIRRAEEEIRATNELLAKTKKDKQVTQNQLKLIQNRIRNRKQIIANLEKQTQVINGDIGTKNDTVHAMQNELTQLRKEYADMVYAAYKNYKLNNFLVFLFASKDFNDATRRISYMRRYNRMRQQKAEQIKSVADSLHVQIGELENRKAELTKVRDTRTQEVSSLGKDEKQYQSSLSEINTKSGKLSSEIRKKQSQINKLQQRIQAIIAEEARKNRATPKSAAQEEYIANLSGPKQRPAALSRPRRRDRRPLRRPSARHTERFDGKQQGRQYRFGKRRGSTCGIRGRYHPDCLRAGTQQYRHNPPR